MSASSASTFDAVVVGGNLAGLFAALQLRQLGFSVCVVESSPHWGGWDRSIVNARGSRFDMGFHVVDHERSFVSTRVVSELLGEDAIVQRLERHMVLGGAELQYGSPPEQWPDNLQPLLRECTDLDAIDDGKVTLESLRKTYGKSFLDFVMNSIVPAHPTLVELRDCGVSPEHLLVNIYPWFFPNIDRVGERIGESSRYHDRMRRERSQQIIYPAEGGFAAITDRIRSRLVSAGVTMRLGVGPVEVALSSDGMRVEELRVEGQSVRTHLYVWSAGIGPIFKVLGIPAPAAIPVEYLLGSFEFDRPLGTTPHEVLCGDPELAINRMSFPRQLVRDRQNTLVQVEIAVPKRPDQISDAEWITRWSADLAKLGYLRAPNMVVAADVMRLPMAICLPGVEAAALEPVLQHFDAAESNLCLIARSFTPRNINQALPDTIARIAAFAGR